MRHTTIRFVFLASTACALSGCKAASAPPRQAIASSSSELASVSGGVEGAIDAPWRLEPDPTSVPPYPAIPILISIHDASMQVDPESAQPLGQFCELSIREEDLGTTVVDPASPSLHEIERSDEWTPDSDVAANHRLCRHWAGQNCANELDVGSSAEWHATVLYAPKNPGAGTDVHLTVQARVARAGYSCGAPRPIYDGALFDRLGPYPHPNDVLRDYVITNRLMVHLGEAALPRFDDGWVYGDLHYHSQGTDNEGESGYAYRPTLQAVRAMGLDFVFATDHASDSIQITDIREIYLDQIPHIGEYLPAFMANFLNRLAAANAKIGIETESNAARDMNDQRWRAMRSWLNDRPSGANAEIMMAAGSHHAARMFLGGEVDVIPEISAEERALGVLRYGNGKVFVWGSACTDLPDEIQSSVDFTTNTVCHSADDLVKEAPEGGRFKLKDMQGLGDASFYGRQHMVHLPTDGARVDGFVSSRTSEWGGATRRLVGHDPVNGTRNGVLVEDYEVANKGYAFLAHPTVAPSGKGMGRIGPDVIPYSDVQLRTAFESPFVLGLQLWNEDNRVSSIEDGPKIGFPIQTLCASTDGDCPGTIGPGGEIIYPSVPTMWRWKTWYGASPPDAYGQLHDGLAAWDKMLLWGIRPSQLAGLSWLPANTPRRVFMAGGSDAHGDLNYRREGSVTGLSAAVDTAIGKPRNLVFVGTGRPETVNGPGGASFSTVGQQQVTAGLASGQFAITDGPALRIAVDVNGNGVIDAADVPMGGVTNLPSGGSLPLIVEWKSTAEFGAIAGIDLYVGVTNDAIDEGLVYAPANHGVHATTTPSGAVDPHPYLDSGGDPHSQLYDGYMLDPKGTLHITPAAGNAMAGHMTVNLHPSDYPVGRRTTHQDPQICYNPCSSNEADGPISIDSSAQGECDIVCYPLPPREYHFENLSAPDRVYVRAFARTVRPAGAQCGAGDPVSVDVQLHGRCIERLAFTNPIWMRSGPCVPDPLSVTCASKQCGPTLNNCGQAVTCPDTCPAGTLCGGGNGGPNVCGCEDLAKTCAFKNCGPAVNNCGVTVTCPNKCFAPTVCGGGGVGPNQCGCTSNGNPCGDQCAGTATDNCGNVFSCYNDCGMSGMCPCAGGQCVSNYCVCYTNECL